MIKASELMVGDKVLHDGKYKEVITIWPRSVSLYDSSQTWGSIYADNHTESEIEPIPLTPEILEKNGFIWTGGGDSTKMYSTPWGYDGIRYNLYVGLKKKTIEVYAAHPELRSESWRKVNKVSLEVCGCYVHEFQHALRLCGIDKEIVL